MIFYYAMGGGLGHLTRARAIIHTLSLKDYRVITASPYARKMFDSSDLVILPVSLEKNIRLLKKRIQDIILDFEPAEIYIDTFPMGIFGELTGLKISGNARKIYVSRILDFPKYMSKKEMTFHFDLSYILEEGLTPDHLDFIDENSNRIEELQLHYPLNSISERNNEHEQDTEKEVWMIMHSGSAGEVELLMGYARETAGIKGVDPYYWIVTQSDVHTKADKITRDLIPTYELISHADCLFSACGFNMMYHTRNLKIPHYFIPFPRKYDDQFLRARLRREGR